MKVRNNWIVDIYIYHQQKLAEEFVFPIHSRKLVVERLFFHLPCEQAVYSKDNEVIDDVLLNPSVIESMFTLLDGCK